MNYSCPVCRKTTSDKENTNAWEYSLTTGVLLTVYEFYIPVKQGVHFELSEFVKRSEVFNTTIPDSSFNQFKESLSDTLFRQFMNLTRYIETRYIKIAECPKEDYPELYDNVYTNVAGHKSVNIYNITLTEN